VAQQQLYGNVANWLVREMVNNNNKTSVREPKAYHNASQIKPN